MNSNLFNIEAEYLAIVDEIEQNEGEITPELDEQLSINKEELDVKFQAYIHVVKQKEADVELAKDEIDRLRLFVKRNETTVKQLKNKLMEAMRFFGLFGKSGNLSYKVVSHSMFSRNTVATVVNDGYPITYDKSLSIPEFVKYEVVTKFTKDQLIKIRAVVTIDEDNIVVIPDKKLIKSSLLITGNKPDEIASEITSENGIILEVITTPLQEIAELVNNESLTIR